MKHFKGTYIVKEYIYYYLQKHKLSKRKFCKLCGVERKVLNQIKNQDGNLNLQDIMDVFDYINVPMKYAFITLDGEKLKRFENNKKDEQL